MPTRVVREGALDSAKLAGVSRGADAMFFRLLLVADDFGCFDGRASVIRARCFPAHRDVQEEHVAGWCSELFHAGLIHGYVVNAKPYLSIPNFHQRRRAMKSKFPSLSEADGQLTDVWQTNDGHFGEVAPAVSTRLSPPPPPLASVRGSPASDGRVDGRCRTNDGQLTDKSERERAVSLRTWLRAAPEDDMEEVGCPPELVEACRRIRPDVDPAAVWALFRDHWISVPSSKATKIDWPATWRKWVRGERAGGVAAGKQTAIEAKNAQAAEGWVAPEEKPVQGALVEPEA
jgi:hypothetical protein